MKTKNYQLLAKLALFIVAFFWGTSMTVVNDVAKIYPTHFINALRFGMAGIFLLMVFYKQMLGMKRQTLKYGCLLGSFLFIGYFLQTQAVHYTTPGRSAILAATYCVIVPFIFWFVKKERPSFFNILAALICVIGVYFVGGANVNLFAIEDLSGTTLVGDLMSILCGFFYAAHIVTVSIISHDHNPIHLSVVQFIVTALAAALCMFCLEDWQSLSFNARGIGEIAYLALFCTAIALLVQTVAQRYCTASSASIIISVESVFGITFPVLIGVETLNGTAILGCFLIIGAIAISEILPLYFSKRQCNN